MEMEQVSLKSRWTKLDGERSAVLDRAKQCTELTIPSLLVDATHTEEVTLSTPYQSLGARAVNNLASKLLLSLLPPNAPFFRFVPDKLAMMELEEQEAGSMAQVQEKLADLERGLAAQIEREALRVPIFESLKLLVATGNALIFRDKGDGTRVFNLNAYCVKRSPEGKIKEILTKEQVRADDLPEGMSKDATEDKAIDLYTAVKWNGTKYDVWQEALDQEVPGTRGTYSDKNLPYLTLRWTSVHNEDYGRGLVEQYIGDLRSLEALAMSIVEASAAAAKVLFFVDPVGSTQISTVAKAASGAIVKGRASDVSTLQMDKSHDLNIAYQTMNDIQRRLASAFLLNESARRDAERVTAEEVRLMAGELEDALGGIYSILTQELQLPLIKLMMLTSKIKFPENLVEPVIVTGVEALGRGHDYNKLVQFSQTLQQLLGPEIFAQHTNVDAVIEQIGTSLGIETKGLIKSKEQIQMEQQQAMMQQLSQQGMGAAAESGGKAAGEGLGGPMAAQMAQQMGMKPNEG
jgi:hypothetical protein